jgi:hypothetical protein
MPALVEAAGERAGVRFLEFFASAIRNPHTRRAYARAASDFLAWCTGAGVPSITAVRPLHVATWIELQTQTHAAPTVRQRLAAIRHLGSSPARSCHTTRPRRFGVRRIPSRPAGRRCSTRPRRGS